MRREKPLLLHAKKDWALDGAKDRKGRRIVSLLMQPGALEAHNYELEKNYEKIAAAETAFEIYNPQKEYDYLIAAFGTTARISKGAINLAKEKGIRIALFRPVTLWPFPSKALKEAAEKVKKVFVFEMNMGQMVEDVRLSLEGKPEVVFFGRPGGGIPASEQLLEFIEKNK